MLNANAAQKLTLKIAAGCIAALLVYPPCRLYLGVEQHLYGFAGHNWFWVVMGGETVVDTGLVGINWPVLLTQWLGILLVAGLFYLAVAE